MIKSTNEMFTIVIKKYSVKGKTNSFVLATQTRKLNFFIYKFP